MKSILSLLSLFAITVLATSCATYSSLSPEDLKSRGLKPDEGLIVGSFHSRTINRNGEALNGNLMGMEVSGRNTGNKETFGIYPGQLGGESKSVFAIPAPAGNYEINRWAITAGGYNSTVTASNRLPMNVPFQVRAGEAVYVGRMNSLAIYGRNLLGLPVFADGAIIATDAYQKDSAEIAKTYPTIQRSKIRKSDVPAAYLKDMKRIADTPTWLDKLLR